MMLPNTFIEGTLASDPVLRQAQSGTWWAKVRIAAKESKREQGKWVDGDPTYIDVVCFGRNAENLARSAHTGDTVMVWGLLKQREYEVDGEKRHGYQVTADSVGLSLRWVPWTEGQYGPGVTPSATADGPEDPPF